MSQIAKKTACKVTEVRNLCVWGNHSSTMFPDSFNAKILGKGPLRASLKTQEKWLDSEFLSRVQKRGAEIIAAMNKSSAASAANAICDHVRDLWLGTKPGVCVSMAVISDANPYGVPEGLFYSFPCTVKNQEWTIAPNWTIN